MERERGTTNRSLPASVALGEAVLFHSTASGEALLFQYGIRWTHNTCLPVLLDRLENQIVNTSGNTYLPLDICT